MEQDKYFDDNLGFFINKHLETEENQNTNITPCETVQTEETKPPEKRQPCALRAFRCRGSDPPLYGHAQPLRFWKISG